MKKIFGNKVIFAGSVVVITVLVSVVIFLTLNGRTTAPPPFAEKPGFQNSAQPQGTNSLSPPPSRALATVVPEGGTLENAEAETFTLRYRHFRGAEIIASEEVESGKPGEVIHLELLKTNFAYPQILTTDKRRKNPATGKMIIADQIAMVADHLLVEKSDKISDQEFQGLVKSSGCEILRQVSNSLYVVRFEINSDLHTLERFKAALNARGAGNVKAEPDYIRFADDKF